MGRSIKQCPMTKKNQVLAVPSRPAYHIDFSLCVEKLMNLLRNCWGRNGYPPHNGSNPHCKHFQTVIWGTPHEKLLWVAFGEMTNVMYVLVPEQPPFPKRRQTQQQ